MNYIIKIFYGIKDEVNGCVRYEAYPSMDAVIFDIKFKDYVFKCPINKIQEKISNCVSVRDVVNYVKEEYRKALLSTFFKSDNRKMKDKMEGRHNKWD